jgi:hypothetical protein
MFIYSILRTTQPFQLDFLIWPWSELGLFLGFLARCGFVPSFVVNAVRMS